MQHFFINQDVSGDHAVITDDELFHQMKHVLRFEKGDKCVLLDGKGEKAHGTIETIDKKVIIIALKDHEKCTRTKQNISLYIAIPKKTAIFELIIQKATELGISNIIPVVTEHCQVRELRNEKRLLAIIKEAAEQCERAFLPELHPVLKFEKFCSSPPPGKILTGDARMSDLKLSEVDISSTENINLIIGPEGGLSENELLAVRKIGGKIFTLGNTVLRMETAAIASLSIILCR